MQQITVQNAGTESAQIQLSQGLINARESALAEAALIGEINDAKDLEAAAHVLGELKSLEKTITKAHKEAKDPYLAITKQLDGLKREYVAAITPETTRLSRLVGDYQEIQRRKAEEAKRKAEEERRRIEAEQFAKEDAIRKEAVESIKATGDVQEGYREQLDAVRAEAKEQRAEVRNELAAAAVSKSAGVRKQWKYEVTDIAELARVRPELVRMEPNASAIMALVRSTEGNLHLPGLRVWSEAVGTVRGVAAKSVAEIEQNDF